MPTAPSQAQGTGFRHCYPNFSIPLGYTAEGEAQSDPDVHHSLGAGSGVIWRRDMEINLALPWSCSAVAVPRDVVQKLLFIQPSPGARSSPDSKTIKLKD